MCLKNKKRLILIDLDGVLNIYDGNFVVSEIPLIRDGALGFIKDLSKIYRIKIFTSRNLLLTAKWVFENNLDVYIEDITNIKEPCSLIIDDRCICFSGDFSKLKEKIKKFNVFYV